MTVAVVAALVGLGCLLLGFWVGWQLGQQTEYQRQWEETTARMRHPTYDEEKSLLQETVDRLWGRGHE